MMETPYKMAFFFPSAFVLLCFVKKLTVIGIIGKTQGVNNAANPPKNAKKKIDHNPFSSVFGVVVAATSCVGFSVTDVSTTAVVSALTEVVSFETTLVGATSSTLISGNLNVNVASC